MNKKILVLLAIVLLALIAFIMTERAYSVTVSRFGESCSGGNVTILKNYSWRSAPKNPEIVYISVRAPEPYKMYIMRAITGVVENCSLRPVVNDDPPDLKGRVVIVFIPGIGKGDYTFYTEKSVSGILYYSYAGDVVSFNTTINKGFTLSKTEISKLADKLNQASQNRLICLRMPNMSVCVDYWWNLKVTEGKLSGVNPYVLIADKIAHQLEINLQKHSGVSYRRVSYSDNITL